MQPEDRLVVVFRLEKYEDGHAYLYEQGSPSPFFVVVPEGQLPEFTKGRGIRASVAVKTLEALRCGNVCVQDLSEIFTNPQPGVPYRISRMTEKELLEQIGRALGGVNGYIQSRSRK